MTTGGVSGSDDASNVPAIQQPNMNAPNEAAGNFSLNQGKNTMESVVTPMQMAANQAKLTTAKKNAAAANAEAAKHPTAANETRAQEMQKLLQEIEIQIFEQIHAQDAQAQQQIKKILNGDD